MEKVDEGEVLEGSDDEEEDEEEDDDDDTSGLEDSGESSAEDIEDSGDADDANPLLVNADEDADQATKTKLWFGKVRKRKYQSKEQDVRDVTRCFSIPSSLFSRKCSKVLKRWRMKILRWNR